MEITRDGCVRIRTSQELIDHEKGFDKELGGSDNSASQSRFTSDCRLLHPPGYSCRMLQNARAPRGHALCGPRQTVCRAIQQGSTNVRECKSHSAHSLIKIELREKLITLISRKASTIWKLDRSLLTNRRAKVEVVRAIRKYFNLNDNENKSKCVWYKRTVLERKL